MKHCNMETARGTKCQRPAGWGTGGHIGPCKGHLRVGARRAARKRGLSVIEGGLVVGPAENLLARTMFLPY